MSSMISHPDTAPSSLIPLILAKPDAHAVASAAGHIRDALVEARIVDGLPAGAGPRPVASAAVIGSGTMGAGIAMALAAAGIEVRLMDMAAASLERAAAAVRKTFETQQAKGRISAEEAAARIGRIATTTDLASLADVDLFIEAVFEDLSVKQTLMGRIDALARPGAILATNTSYLDIDAIAAATTRPADVVGLHFFSPANIMRLLEVVRGAATAPDVLATAFAIADRMGKVPVVSGVAYGFIGNRIMQAYVRQAHLMLLEGAEPRQIDQAIEAFGLPMGPFRMADMAGLDIGYRSRRERTLSDEEKRAFRVADCLVEKGRLGLKSGGGFYDYATGSRAAQPSEASAAVIAEMREGMSDLSNDYIVERCLFALVNEGHRVLAEGVAARPGDIDLVYLNGYGFPADRGGPMWWASQQVGLGQVVATLDALHAATGFPSLMPAPGLCAAAAQVDARAATSCS
jgi:3-hydroxyacyl-CoA dehydrogenase